MRRERERKKERRRMRGKRGERARVYIEMAGLAVQVHIYTCIYVYLAFLG
jgi:hypothetical protein